MRSLQDTADKAVTIERSLLWVDTLTNDYDFASTNWPYMQKVLKIRSPRDYSDACVLTVPTGVRHCCGCPEHEQNGVSLAYCRRVNVIDEAGADFHSSDESQTVRIAATEPSYEPGDGAALFVTNDDLGTCPPLSDNCAY